MSESYRLREHQISTIKQIKKPITTHQALAYCPFHRPRSPRLSDVLVPDLREWALASYFRPVERSLDPSSRPWLFSELHIGRLAPNPTKGGQSKGNGVDREKLRDNPPMIAVFPGTSNTNLDKFFELCGTVGNDKCRPRASRYKYRRLSWRRRCQDGNGGFV